jgi:cation diffusion facilitator CzcD-associated flavoprotein CzcO
VDSQYPVYALSIPEVYKEWTWTSHYPDHVELRQYFDHVESILHVKKDCVFDSKVVEAVWDTESSTWTIRCDTGKTFQTRFWTACTGFAAKRYFPDWEGLEDFRGTIHHSSFWPEEGVDVRGKRVAVIGTGATGVQITQEVGASYRVSHQSIFEGLTLFSGPEKSGTMAI